MWEIAKTFSFAAAHHLVGLAADHPCSRPHGHTYTATITLRGTALPENGMIVDYRELDRTIGIWIDEVFDHHDLNEVFTEIRGGRQTSAENIAQVLYEKCKQYSWAHYLHSVTVCESPKTRATYFGKAS